jgi:hypothetical protein
MDRTAQFLGILFLVFAPAVVPAQEKPPPDSGAVPSRQARADTSRNTPGDWRFLGADSISAPRRQAKSTTTAVLLSAVLPGAGQFYNGSYWKVPIVTGLGAYFAYEFFSNNSKYQDYKDLYTASQPDIGGGNQRYYTLREFYRKERDRFGWYFLLLYIVNLVDAYVDASLSDFAISDDVTLQLVPGTSGSPGGPVTFGLRLTF